MPRSTKPPAPSRPSANAVFIYDGQELSGVIDERSDGRFDAFDAANKHIGTFRSHLEAMRAIPSPNKGAG